MTRPDHPPPGAGVRSLASRVARLARPLRAEPGVTALAVLVMALGIGASTAVFSVVDAVLLRPLPYPEPDRLVRVFGTSASRGDELASLSIPDYVDYAAATRSLARLGLFVRWSYTVADEEAAERVWGGIVTASLFPTLGVEPVLGRTFLPEEDHPTGRRVVVLGHELWQRLFAGSADVLGSTLRLDDLEHTIVGVMPAGFEFPSDARLWTPVRGSRETSPRGTHGLRGLGRLAAGASLAEAQAELSAIARRLEASYPETNSGWGVALLPLSEAVVGEVRPALWLLFGASGLLLAIACANLASLLLARAADGRSELAVRRALGAERSHLVGHFLLQALPIAVLGGGLGVLLGRLGVKALTALELARENASFQAESLHTIPRLSEVGLDGRVLAVAALLTLGTAFAMSLLPALRLPDPDLAPLLKEGGGTARGGAGAARLRRLLVISEVALAFALAIAAGLLARSFAALTTVDPGFQARHVLTFEIFLPATRYPEGHETAAFLDRLLARLEALPGVRSAGAAWALPLGGLSAHAELTIEDKPHLGSGADRPEAALQPVSPGYFRTLGIPLLAGRFFGEEDHAGSPPVAIVNHTLAKRFWPGEEALGKRLTFSAVFGPMARVPRATREVVGVVADVKGADLAAAPAPELYFPFRQTLWRMVTLAVETAGDPLLASDAVRREVRSLDPGLAVSALRTMDQVLARSLAGRRFNVALLGLFAGAGLVLALAGIVGVVAHSVARQTAEIGLRMALGARRPQVVRRVVAEGVGLAAVGLAIGLAAALALTRLLSGLLFGVTATDPLTFVAVSAACLLLAAAASYLPARRASRVEPLAALRALAALVVAGALFSGCGGERPPAGAVRLFDRFATARIEGTPQGAAPLDPVAWSFEGPPAEGGETPRPGGFLAGPGTADLEARGGFLSGRTTRELAILALEPPRPLAGDEPLHAVEVTLSATAGSHLYVRFVETPDLDLARLDAQPANLVWRLRAPLVPGDELRTYTLSPPQRVRARQIRHLLLCPTDAVGARFEIASVRLVFAREHLAGLPSGPGWHGLSEVYRETLLARAPERLRFELVLPERPELHLAVGTLDEEAVTFRVAVVPAGGGAAAAAPRTVFERRVAEPWRWQEVVVDLGAAAGRRAELTLSLEAGRPGAIGLWGTPVVRSRAADRPANEDAAAGAPQGVVLILTDTLRRDRLRAYGHDRETAPAISRLAEEGVLFEDAQAQATWTKAAVPSILTSLYPGSHGVLRWDDRLPASAHTLAEAYRDAGHATLSLSSIFFTGRMSNLHQGFEVVHEAPSLGAEPPTKTARACVDRLLDWLPRQREVPFFVLLHLFDPHFPYRPRPPDDARFTDAKRAAEHPARVEVVRGSIADPFFRLVGLPTEEEIRDAGLDPGDYVANERDWYDGSVYAMDAEIGRLLERLRAPDLAGRVLVVLVSDHGEEFLDHGRMFHGQSVFGELTNVPLVIWRPGALPAGARVRATVETLDVMPTLLEMSGIKAPEGLQGKSLAPLLRAAGRPVSSDGAARPAFSEKRALDDILGPPPRDTESYAVIWDGWKLVHNVRRGTTVPEHQLFDHDRDPLDHVDVAARHPQVVSRLKDLLLRWRNRVEAQRLPTDGELKPQLSAAELERLRSLGYL